MGLCPQLLLVTALPPDYIRCVLEYCIVETLLINQQPYGLLICCFDGNPHSAIQR